MRILLTGARAPVTLDLARHFHRAGHEVFLADSVRLPVAAPSRAVRRTFLVTRPVASPQQFVVDLAAIAREQQIDLLVPTCEEIYYIAARLQEFPARTRVFAEPLERLTLLHSKWEFAERVRQWPYAARAPETRLLTCAEDLRDWPGSLDPSAWVFKPVFSRFASRTLIGPTAEQLAAVRPTATDAWVAQRRVYGQEYSTYSVAQAGKLRAHACYRSEYRAGPGSGIYFLPIDHAAIRTFVTQFVEPHSFTGQIGFDFIDTGQGEVYVLECNPRATSGLHMLDGLPLADAFLQAEGPLLEPTSLQPKMLGSIMLMFPLPQAARRWQLGKFCRDLLRARDVIFDRRDFLPALLSPLSLLEVIVIACRTGKPLTKASTFDIEWNGEPL